MLTICFLFFNDHTVKILNRIIAICDKRLPNISDLKSQRTLFCNP